MEKKIVSGYRERKRSAMRHPAEARDFTRRENIRFARGINMVNTPARFPSRGGVHRHAIISEFTDDAPWLL